MKGNENYEYHVAHCAFCGKRVFWELLLNRLIELTNGWSAHRKCYNNYRKKGGTAK